MIGSTLLLIRSLIQNGANPKPATGDEADNGYSFIPSCVCEFQMLGIQNFAVKDFTYYTQDINCGNDDTCCCH